MDTSTVLFAFGLTLFAGLATGIGGLIAVARKTVTEGFLAGSLGFSVGVMLYVSFVEILPGAFDELTSVWGEKGGSWAAVIGFFGGIALIAIIDRLVPTAINPHEPSTVGGAVEGFERRNRMMKMGVLTALAIAIHNFPEGFATFLAGLSDPMIAIPVAVAIAIHNIPEGIAVAVPLREATGSRRKALGWATLSGLAEPAGALIGFLLLMPFIGPEALGLCFAAVAGVMVFISVDELLPTAISSGKHHTAIYGLIAGMAVMAISLLLFI
ncbi:putative divalent heavy-metal cation transporter [Corynebacterium glutamicum MB001]|uniref:zinc transporter ZupT n=1 Tax=Corynebacterium glutamicum TaxID=1718 RepID=UPI0000165D52|nr:zinc transporter ZupT [Corynebacterium glutamicum]AGT05401.1 putative divalent heavy-metal cation transporter [Corynebacterium glutamicum MB001]ARV64423.1 zinc transporter ZupT [Corynebacterium glutamicum]ASW14051.1 putative divalent heavy-metal cation transporter [Corynebacterium glutamicum]AUI00956.1 zinc transporter ZupT [Corynebacterium glutamicum]AUI04599.1 zinc transporter ZupT [Corynebacterium glutamicum]